MKKNLLTVLILALLIVNLILTSVMMVSVMGTNKKTSRLVGDIASVMNLSLTQPGQEDKNQEVSLADTQTYDLSGTMTIPLSDGGYILFDVSLSMNKKHKDYKKYGGENIQSWESLIKVKVNSVVSERTTEQCRGDLEGLKTDILLELQDLFQSDFIYNVGISGVKFG